MNKILLVFGTRPELIKLAPIINEYRKRNQRKRLYVINTSQHKHFTQEDLNYFQIDIDFQFKLERNNDSLSLLNGLLLLEFDKLKQKLNKLNITIDAIIAQGDTCTAFSSALFSFYETIPFFHIEAGLRTEDLSQPFPEEFFRKTISCITSIHFAPTKASEKNLINEGVDLNSILVTGNTGIDNLKHLNNLNEHKDFNIVNNKLVLLTIHRRENIKNNLQSIIHRITYYIKNNPDKSFLWIDNPGFKIKNCINMKFDNLKIIQPISFIEMVKIYKKSQLIITDSGGIQEEAAYLGIPTLLFRTKTERIEGIDTGISKYIEDSDIDLDYVIKELNNNIDKTNFKTIYGDGDASMRIVDYLTEKGY